MRISTNDRRTITIDSFYVTRTYGGMLEGLPTRDLNTSLIESAKKIEKLWGQRKIHVVTPATRPVAPYGGDVADPRSRQLIESAAAHYKNPEILPKWQCFAWLDSTALAEESHGSQVVLIWWADEVESFSIPELVEDALRGIKWEDVAEDYEV